MNQPKLLDTVTNLQSIPQEKLTLLEKQETIKRRLKARFSQLPKETSLANELIAERHEEAKREVKE